MKETKNREKKDSADRTDFGPAGPSYMPPRVADFTRRTSRSSPAPRAQPPFFLYLFLFFRTYLYSNTYISSYTTLFFGSVCFYTFLTRNPNSPTDLLVYIYPHLYTSEFLSPKSQNLSPETLTSIFEPLNFVICLWPLNQICRSSIPTNLISFRPP
jgi:hypothetical protein